MLETIPLSDCLEYVYKSIPGSYAQPVARLQKNVRDLRKAAGLTQEQLAERAKVKQATISKWETGTTPDITSLLRVAVGLERSLDALVDGVDPEYDEKQRTRSAMDGEAGKLWSQLDDAQRESVITVMRAMPRASAPAVSAVRQKPGAAPIARRRR